jgi:hypothetical protein
VCGDLGGEPGGGVLDGDWHLGTDATAGGLCRELLLRRIHFGMEPLRGTGVIRQLPSERLHRQCFSP